MVKLLPQYCESLPARIEWLSGHCPVQATGTIAGLPFYFRARWDSYDLAIASALDKDPVFVQLLWEPGYLITRAYGAQDEYEASWMDHKTARKLIYEHARRFIHSRHFVEGSLP